MPIALGLSAGSESRIPLGLVIVGGILVYILYGNLLYLCRTWVTGGVLPAWIGMWWVHLLFLTISFVWIRRQGRFRSSVITSYSIHYTKLYEACISHHHPGSGWSATQSRRLLSFLICSWNPGGDKDTIRDAIQSVILLFHGALWKVWGSDLPAKAIQCHFFTFTASYNFV